MRNEAKRFWFGMMSAAALVMTAGGCSDDGVSPEPDTVLATISFSYRVISLDPPDVPNGISIQFGVYSDPRDPSSQYPIPFPFGDKMMSRQGQTVWYPMTLGGAPGTVAARLMDGDDEGIFYWYEFDGQPKVGIGANESNGLTYAVTRNGPDLVGYVVTSFATTLDVFSVTQGGGNWTLATQVTGKFYGHKL
jgi:hypothetical protein